MGWVTLALKKKLALAPVHFTSSQAGRQRREEWRSGWDNSFRGKVYSHFIEASVFLALPPNYFTSQLFLPLCLWWELAMGTGLDRFLWSVLLLLPVFGLSEALPESWLPGEYSDTISDAQRFLSDYNSTAEEVFFHSVSASWNYNTNITDHNSKLQVRHLQSRAHKTTWWATFSLMLIFHCPLYITLVSTSILSPEMQFSGELSSAWLGDYYYSSLSSIACSVSSQRSQLCLRFTGK